MEGGFNARTISGHRPISPSSEYAHVINLIPTTFYVISNKKKKTINFCLERTHINNKCPACMNMRLTDDLHMPNSNFDNSPRQKSYKMREKRGEESREERLHVFQKILDGREPTTLARS